MVKEKKPEDVNITGYSIFTVFDMYVRGVTRVIVKGKIKKLIMELDIEMLKLAEMNWHIEDWEAIVYVVDDLII